MLPAHSKIGASSSKRWLSCPGSIALSQGIPNRGSQYAMEGTAAHELAEMCLNEYFDAQYYVATNHVITVHQDGTDYLFPVTQEMADAVQVYLDFVRKDEPFDTLVEVKFHLKELHEGLFGTADCVQWFADEAKLRVIDYKHGQGTPVEAEGNPQGMYYALGALTALRFPARVVEIVIVQPRCPHGAGPIRSWTIGVDELLDWQADLLDGVKRVEHASRLHDPASFEKLPNIAAQWSDGYLASGDHCKFCPAAAVPGRCSAIADKQQALARVEFAPMVDYDPAKLAQALLDIPMVEQRIKAIREFAYAEAEAGRCPPGWKLVEKRAISKLRDDADHDEMAALLGVPKDELFKERELKNYGDLKSMAPGKNDKERTAALAPFVSKVSSGHTLAPAEDKRAAVKSSAQLDFIDN
jgi:hypothetical protein